MNDLLRLGISKREYVTSEYCTNIRTIDLYNPSNEGKAKIYPKAWKSDKSIHALHNALVMLLQGIDIFSGASGYQGLPERGIIGTSQFAVSPIAEDIPWGEFWVSI